MLTHCSTYTIVQKNARNSTDSAPGSDLDSDSDSNSDSDLDSSDKSDDLEDLNTDLVLCNHGRRLKLKRQHPRVKRVARQAINNTLLNIYTINVYPEGPGKSSDYVQNILIQSAKTLGDTEIARRLKREETYCQKLALIVCLSIFYPIHIHADHTDLSAI